jgi:hypothetical protein
MRYINLHGSGGPADVSGAADAAWIAEAQALLQRMVAARNQDERHALIDANQAFWGRLRDWLLRLSHDKCWYSEARDVFSVLEVEHYRPKKRCKRKPRGVVNEGYWWLAFDWSNYRLCGKVGNARKGDFFPLARESPVATHSGLSIRNEIPLLLDPACPGDPDLLSFNEDGACGPHADAEPLTRLRVETTTSRLNLNNGRLKKARQRVWARCWQLIDDCRELAHQMDQAPGPADWERLNMKKEELRSLVRPESEFSATAKNCLLKSNIGWACTLAAG